MVTTHDPEYKIYLHIITHHFKTSFSLFIGCLLRVEPTWSVHQCHVAKTVSPKIVPVHGSSPSEYGRLHMNQTNHIKIYCHTNLEELKDLNTFKTYSMLEINISQYIL